MPGACQLSYAAASALHYRLVAARNAGLHVCLDVRSTSNPAGFLLDLSLGKDIASYH